MTTTITEKLNELARGITGLIFGEMAVNDIPAAGGIDVEALKAGDDDPMEVIVRIPSGRSTRGWFYTPAAIKAFVAAVNEMSLPGMMGHQEEYKLDTEFPPLATHWVGAAWNDGEQAGYFRGVIDKSQPDLKRWIRAKAIRQVSIFGNMAMEYDYQADNYVVVGSVPLSIDWTPLNRAGMPTEVVATGEQHIPKGEKTMTLQEALQALKQALSGGNYSLQKLAGEMGWTAEQLAGEIDRAWLDKLTTDVKLAGEIRTALGVGADGDPLAKIRELLSQAHQVRVTGLVQKHVSGEMAQTLVGRMLRTTPEQTDEQIVGEINVLLGDETLKQVLGDAHKDMSGGVDAGKQKDNGKETSSVATAAGDVTYAEL